MIVLWLLFIFVLAALVLLAARKADAIGGWIRKAFQPFTEDKGENVSDEEE